MIYVGIPLLMLAGTQALTRMPWPGVASSVFLLALATEVGAKLSFAAGLAILVSGIISGARTRSLIIARRAVRQRAAKRVG
jgi:hypothetical protein